MLAGDLDYRKLAAAGRSTLAGQCEVFTQRGEIVLACEHLLLVRRSVQGLQNSGAQAGSLVWCPRA